MPQSQSATTSVPDSQTTGPVAQRRSQRRPWSETDNKNLMNYWDVIGSVALIAIMIGRSPSSVQTQASRLGLPPRDDEKDRHRRRWSSEEEIALDRAISDLTRLDGRIPIVDVASSIGRSVDAIVARLEARHGAGSSIMERLIAPPPPKVSGGLKERSVDPNVRNAHTKRRKEQDCLRCRKPFYSAGSHNWVCSGCKRSEEWISD